mmetsp:Transcript_49316/g.152037  ORF Transcript_49316/g.152037 Transcript_49316/m.152037 type:complete len:461 (+) Transcript_49316:884-2266(+)
MDGLQVLPDVLEEVAALGVGAVAEAHDHDHRGVDERQQGAEGAVGQGRQVLQQAEGQRREEREADEARVARQLDAQSRHDLLEEIPKVARVAEEGPEGHDHDHQKRDPRSAGAHDERPLRGEVALARDLAGPPTTPHRVDAQGIEHDGEHNHPDVARAVHAVGDGEEAGGAEVCDDVHHEGGGAHRLLALLGAPPLRRPSLPDRAPRLTARRPRPDDAASVGAGKPALVGEAALPERSRHGGGLLDLGFRLLRQLQAPLLRHGVREPSAPRPACREVGLHVPQGGSRLREAPVTGRDALLLLLGELGLRLAAVEDHATVRADGNASQSGKDEDGDHGVEMAARVDDAAGLGGRDGRLVVRCVVANARRQRILRGPLLDRISRLAGARERPLRHGLVGRGVGPAGDAGLVQGGARLGLRVLHNLHLDSRDAVERPALVPLEGRRPGRCRRGGRHGRGERRR